MRETRENPTTTAILMLMAWTLLAQGSGTAHASTLQTWDGDAGDGLWRTALNWTGDDVPDTVEEEALIDGNDGTASTVTLKLGTSGVSETMNLGGARVEGGDVWNIRAGGSGYSGTLNLSNLFSSGTVDINAGTSGNIGTATVNVLGEGSLTNGPTGTIKVFNTSTSNRRHTILSIQAQNHNEGSIQVSFPGNPDRNSAQLRLLGDGTFTNPGYIVIQYSTNSAASGSAQLALSGNVTLAGTGTVALASVTVDRAQLFSRSGTWVLTNGVNHSITGYGIVGAGDTDPNNSGNAFLTATLNVVNEGLLKATGDTVGLRVIPASTLVNTTTGRILASGAAGLFLGSDSATKTLTNEGRLEARTGSWVRFGTNSTLVLNGTVRGGGTLVGSPTIPVAAATLAPGDSANADGTGTSTVGTLTVDGNLTLASITTVSMQLGDNATAGTDYDTVAVTGNLTLDGMLEVENLVGFGPGTYRLFTCAPGGLTDQGLDSVAGASVVTDVEAGTVDLVVANPATVLLLR